MVESMGIQSRGIRMSVRGNKFVIVCDDCKKVVASVSPAPSGALVCESCMDELWASGKESKPAKVTPEPLRGIIEKGLEKEPVEAESVEAARTRQELEEQNKQLQQELEELRAKNKGKKAPRKRNVRPSN